MSGLVKGVGKIFKSVVKLVKKIAKPVLIAAAIYFTGGLALSAFPATAGFAAALPGFGISASGAATGLFSKAAVSLGLGGGLTGTVAAGGAKVAAAAAGTAVIPGAAAGAAVGPGTALTGGAVTAGATTAAAGGAAVSGAAAAGMAFSDKLLLAAIGTKAVGAFLAPDLETQYTESKRFRGAYYGTYADGSQGEAAQPAAPGAAPAQPTVAAQSVGTPVEAAPARQLMPPALPNQGGQLQAAAPASQVAQPMGPGGPPIESGPIEPRQLMQEGVRYV